MFGPHLNHLKEHHPTTYGLLDSSIICNPDVLIERAEKLAAIKGHHDFDGDQRGAAYRAAQLAVPRAREYGDRRIFSELGHRLGCFSGKHGLDVIGGNGTTARLARNLLTTSPYVVAGDPCFDMVTDALGQELPAVWQCAQDTLFADNSLDFVVGSRGFHHIPVEDRPAAFAEAHRILKRGGVALVVDFEEGSPTARWYSEGLDRFTNTGHQFAHFRRDEFSHLLKDAGFREATVFEVYDPFRFWADTAEGARTTLLKHVIDMFGMLKLQKRCGETAGEFQLRVESTFAPWCTFSASEVAFDAEALRKLSVFREADGRWRAEFPRVALCAAGIK